MYKKLLLFLLLIPSLCFAAPQEIITTGTYIMGDGETPAVAEERAFVAVKQAAVEEAGSYIESYVQTQNWELTKDEVNVVASGVTQTTMLDKQRELVPDGGIRFTVKIRALVDSDGVEAMRNKLSDKRLVEDYRRVQAAYAHSQQEIAQLQGKLKDNTDDTRRRYYQLQIEASEKYFTNIQLVQTADYYYAIGRYHEAKNTYLQALGFFSWYNAHSKNIGYSFVESNSDLNLDEALQEYRRYISVYNHIQERITLIDRTIN